MIKIICEETFNDKTSNSDRELFNMDNFRLIDGDNYVDEELVRSYFLFDDNTDTIFELSIDEAYNLLSLYADKDVEEGVLYENILELIKRIDS